MSPVVSQVSKLYSLKGEATALQGLSACRAASDWLQKLQELQASLKAILAERESTFLEKYLAMAGRSFVRYCEDYNEANLAPPMSPESAVGAGLKVLEAIAARAQGPVSAVLAKVTLDAIESLTSFEDADVIAAVGLSMISRDASTVALDKALACLGLDWGQRHTDISPPLNFLMLPSSSLAARSTVLAALKRRQEGNTGSVLAQVTRAAYDAVVQIAPEPHQEKLRNSRNDALDIAQWGLRAISSNPDCGNEQRVLARLALAQTAGSRSQVLLNEDVARVRLGTLEQIRKL